MSIAAENRHADSTRRFLLWLFLVIVILTVYRASVLWSSGYNLFVDEAYYWGWAQHLDFGYYSKPPMIALLIAMTTSVCGDGEFCIKSGALLVHPLTALLVFYIAKMLYNARVGFYAALTYLTMPGIAWSSMIISTDVVLLFYWAVALLLFIKALRTDNIGYWLAAGLAGGLGLQSKYNMLVFPLSVVVFLMADEHHRQQLKRPGVYSAMVVAVLVFLPNLLWNAYYGFPTFQHTAEISEVGEKSLHIDTLAAFLGGQLGVFGLVFFPLMVYLFTRAKSLWHSEAYRLLICFALPFVALISLLAFLGTANANWATPTYIAGCVLVAAYLIERKKITLWIVAVAINVVLASTAYHWHAITNILDIKLTAKNDPYKRVEGWPALAKSVEQILKQYPSAILLGDARDTIAQLIYYVKPHPFNAVRWNPRGLLRDHYDLTTSMKDKVGKDFIFVTKHANLSLLKASFESVTLIKKIHVAIHDDYALDDQVYYLRGFKGYPHG
jgi:4-amino-4-deoxy-L-arabinose transferase-like glycosyltransferase